MRRLLCLVAVLTAVLVLAPPATADDPPESGSVVGSGLRPPYGVEPFSVNAVGGPDGATGTMSFESGVGNPPIVAAVRCLGIRGNLAVVSGIITASPASPGDAAAVGNELIFVVEDNGTPGDGIDRIGISHGPPAVVPTCLRSEADMHDTMAIPAGEIVVHAGPVLPQSAADCKKGGWKAYGVFKNQGDCVSYAATHGKNPPSGS